MSNIKQKEPSRSAHPGSRLLSVAANAWRHLKDMEESRGGGDSILPILHRINNLNRWALCRWGMDRYFAAIAAEACPLCLGGSFYESAGGFVWKCHKCHPAMDISGD